MATIDKIRLNGTEYEIVDSSAIHSLDGYAKTADVTTAITAATSALAEAIDEKLDDYVTNDEMTAYTYDKATIDEKVGDAFDSDSYYDKDAIDGKLATKVDATAFTEYQGEVAAELADKLEAADVANYFDGASYNDSTKNIEFTHAGAVKATVSALPFIKDGMIDSVKIEGGKLVITWNADASKEVTELEITQIFDASNYYTKEQADKQFGTLAEQTQLRSDVEDLMGEVATLEADKADKGEAYTKAQSDSKYATKNALENKQDKLDGEFIRSVSANTDSNYIQIGNTSFSSFITTNYNYVNFKTINGQSVIANSRGVDITLPTAEDVASAVDAAKTELQGEIAAKADKGESYTKAESDAKYAVKPTVEGTTLILG